VMTKQQPMKMAAAEALCTTEKGAGFSIFAVGSINASCDEVKSVTVPGLLAFLSTDSPNGTVQGVDDLQAQMESRFGPGDYIPSLPITYWSFRLMIGLGVLAVLVGVLGLWLYRRGRTPTGRWWVRLAVAGAITPFLANSFGWIFTEMGRQPWVVAPNLAGNPAIHLLTKAGVSPSVGVGSVLVSLVAFTLVYGALAVVELTLILRYAKAGPLDEAVDAEPSGPGGDDAASGERPMSFAY
jgi:cytochrome d ubiquinol oxidase subunit I